MTTIDTLRETAAILKRIPIPRAERTWGGADVIIRMQAPEPPKTPSFYGEPRCVVTPCALEVSWVFERLWDAFCAENRLDSCTKIEFFGRLANAANRCIEQGHGADPVLLCRSVLHEAFAIYEEMEEGGFRALGIAMNGEIVDDSEDEDGRTGYRNPEDTVRYFIARGLDAGTV